MAFGENNFEKYDKKISKIRGRLHPATARATMFLLTAQKNKGIKGNLLEIGVLGGRHLAMMSLFANDGAKAFGIDPFYLEGTSPAQVMASLTGAACDRNVEIVKSRSDKISIDEYRSRFGPVRFMHIDGSHQYADVVKDLAIADNIVSEDGLLSFDDFLNPYWIGVTQAIFDYMKDTPETTFRPIAYCRNKLFLCRETHLDFYSRQFSAFIEEFGAELKITGATDRISEIFGTKIPVLF